MKKTIALASDIHTEFGHSIEYAVPECDVLVLAGDIGNGVKALQYGERIAQGRARNIVQIAGNHEHYRNELKKTYCEMRDYASTVPNLYFLEQDWVVVDGIRFIGATCWTDFGLTGNQAYAMATASMHMNDYRLIKYQYGENRYGKLGAQVVLDRHWANKQFIFDTLAEPFCGATVVVTHHAPTHLSIHETYAGDFLNCHYANDWFDTIAGLEHPPALWCHGHTHNEFDYWAGNTRVVCNPMGYPNERANPQIRTWEITSAE